MLTTLVKPEHKKSFLIVPHESLIAIECIDEEAASTMALVNETAFVEDIKNFVIETEGLYEGFMTLLSPLVSREGVSDLMAIVAVTAVAVIRTVTLIQTFIPP